MNVWSTALRSVSLGLLLMAPSFAQAKELPTLDDLAQARAVVGSAQAQVSVLIEKAQRGAASDGDRGPRGPRGGRLGFAEDGSEQPENDRLAEFALTVLGSGFNDLGNLIDQASAAYGTGGFAYAVDRACDQAGKLGGLVIAGKVAAAIPRENLVHPFEFDPLEQEARDARKDLRCDQGGGGDHGGHGGGNGGGHGGGNDKSCWANNGQGETPRYDCNGWWCSTEQRNGQAFYCVVGRK